MSFEAASAAGHWVLCNFETKSFVNGDLARDSHSVWDSYWLMKGLVWEKILLQSFTWTVVMVVMVVLVHW